VIFGLGDNAVMFVADVRSAFGVPAEFANPFSGSLPHGLWDLLDREIDDLAE
jgi:hypothetical protein